MPEVFDTVNALVLREVKYKEADRILTLFTSELGRITVKAQGALRKNSRISSSTQQLTYSEMILFKNNGRYTVKEAAVKETFSGLKEDFSNFALGCYFAECIEGLVPEGLADVKIFRMCLNALYALSNKLYGSLALKASFELKLMCLLGYEPDLSVCCVCGKEPELPVLGYDIGRVCCRNCRNSKVGNTEYLCTDSLNAMRFICKAPVNGFIPELTDSDVIYRLARSSEKYLLSRSERGFGALDYWKKVK